MRAESYLAATDRDDLLEVLRVPCLEVLAGSPEHGRSVRLCAGRGIGGFAEDALQHRTTVTPSSTGADQLQGQPGRRKGVVACSNSQ